MFFPAALTCVKTCGLFEFLGPQRPRLQECHESPLTEQNRAFNLREINITSIGRIIIFTITLICAHKLTNLSFHPLTKGRLFSLGTCGSTHKVTMRFFAKDSASESNFNCSNEDRFETTHQYNLCGMFAFLLTTFLK